MKILFENAASIFEFKSSGAEKAQENKIKLYEANLKKNQDAIHWQLSENIEIKKYRWRDLNSLWVEPDIRDDIINFFSCTVNMILSFPLSDINCITIIIWIR